MANLQRSFVAGCAGSEPRLKRKELLDRVLDNLLESFERAEFAVKGKITHDDSANLTLEKDGHCQNFQIDFQIGPEHKHRDVVIEFRVLTKTPWYKADRVKFFSLYDFENDYEDERLLVVDRIAEYMAFKLGKAPTVKQDAPASPTPLPK